MKMYRFLHKAVEPPVIIRHALADLPPAPFFVCCYFSLDV